MKASVALPSGEVPYILDGLNCTTALVRIYFFAQLWFQCQSMEKRCVPSLPLHLLVRRARKDATVLEAHGRESRRIHRFGEVPADGFCLALFFVLAQV